MRYDVLILGVGGMGASALAHLASRGLRVVGIEQDDVPSLRGSSVGETRVIRKAYAEDPRYVPLLERAYVLWRELEERDGRRLFERTGCLNLGSPDHVGVRGALESAETHGLPHERLVEEEVRARFGIVPNAGETGVFEQDAGYLRVDDCTAAHARWARARGGEIRTRARVTSLEIASGGVHVALDDGTRVLADKVVVSAGAWLAGDALGDVARGLRLTVERQVQLWFEPQGAPAPAGHLPAFIHFVPGGPFYGIPPDATRPEPAVKVCRHHGGEITRADALDRELRPEDEQTVRDYVRAHVPSANGRLLRSRVCMYTNTPDEHFVIGRLTRAPHVVVLGGFSGHGYKMASVVGEVAADLIEHGRAAFDLAMFAPDRFA